MVAGLGPGLVSALAGDVSSSTGESKCSTDVEEWIKHTQEVCLMLQVFSRAKSHSVVYTGAEEHDIHPFQL